MSLNSVKINNNDTNYAHSIFDISQLSGHGYDTLSDALADVPDGKQSGGMTVRFVSNNSDNKYVQYRLVKNSWSINISDWENINDELNLNFNYLTRFVDCTIELTYNGDTTLTYTITRGTVQGFIYHQSGYFGVAESKTDTIQLLYDLNILYYDRSDNSIKVTGDSKVVNKQTCVVLEIFYAYHAIPTYSCWTSPDVVKTGIPSDSKGFANNNQINSRFNAVNTSINGLGERITTLEALPKNISRAVYIFSGTLSIKNNGDGTITITKSGDAYIWGDNGDAYRLNLVPSETTITLSIPYSNNYIYYNPSNNAFEKVTGISNLPVNSIILEIIYTWGNNSWVSFWTSRCVGHEDFPDEYINSHSSYVSYSEINSLSKRLHHRRITRLMGCTIALVYNGDTTVTCTITRGSQGFIYHEDGYLGINSTLIEDTLQLIDGVNIVYFDAYQQHTLVTSNINNLNNDCVILEIFYAYRGIPTYSCWTSPDVAKTGIPSDSKGYVSNSRVINLDNRVTALERSPVARVFPYSAKIFRRVGCIGDSYTKGYIYPSGGSVTEDENYAWPHFMETITKNVYSNWGVSGSTAKGWMSGAAKLAQVQANGNKCQAYIIGLMINDRNQAEWNRYYTPVGVIGDIGTDNDTYYAWYYKLVQAVITVNPSAPIFCNTCPAYANNDAYNQAVRDIVAYCRNNNQKVYLNDLASDTYSAMFTNSVFAADAVNGHYTAIGYEFMAECLKEIISDTINANVTDFQNVHLIPFD